MDIKGYWRDVLNQDEKAIAAYFHENACINWHNTDERFTVCEFIRANCEYPGEWCGEIERVKEMGNLLVTAVRVFDKDRSASFHVTSFIKLLNDKIVSLDEYWGDDGKAPQWRLDLNIGNKIGGSHDNLLQI
ncbi:MAG: nuclear transport factor 2 family protein [Firmicutes bacterium]|nr:nuclear transport factor 2 family protein [[Eubacterium] siraeum]MCM1488841.1 nuclear transport factor 2 family protein [Bacillota bacterium]